MMPQDPIVSPNIRLRHPEHFEIGIGSIIDDFCYFSTRVSVGKYCHIASCCTIGGGIKRVFRLGDFSSLSSGVRVWCTSDDFVTDIVTIFPPELGQIKEHLIEGDVQLERLTAVGANSVIMPGNDIPEGTVIGALSYVPPEFDFSPWTVYAGVPIKPVKPRDRDSVMRQLEVFEEKIAGHGQGGL